MCVPSHSSTGQQWSVSPEAIAGVIGGCAHKDTVRCGHGAFVQAEGRHNGCRQTAVCQQRHHVHKK
jgi:hypothetical protein